MPTQYGEDNSTFADELNRLANGGTYPPIEDYVDLNQATATWTGVTGLDIVGSLNTYAGLPQSEWKSMAGVCNFLAGTENLEATAALRFIAS